MRLLRSAPALALAALLLAGSPAHADWPPGPADPLTSPANWPDDPGYQGQWNLWSFMAPENLDSVSAYEASVGSGIHADRAWRQTIGDPAVVIAVLDSGIRWRERDVVNKFYLSRGELPVPQAACGVAAGADAHDVNGDGLFNVQDYTTATGHQQPDVARICDTRVSDGNGNGFLDPQDLITAFSDDLDDDSNGWVDDISGWDAFRDDNDPADDTDFGHGTGEAHDSAAETDNGMGDAGVCPRCQLLMVRIGDAFVVDSNDYATGIVFAVDSGAAVLQPAVGSLNSTRAAYQATEYAWQRNVTTIGSAADEDSFHANQPASLNHTIYVHATTYDTSEREDATTFMAFNNCTNYGANLLLSTPGTGCSSEATGKTAGAAGLMQAAAITAGLAPLDPATDPFGGKRLRPEEIKQLLLTWVDDIYDPDDATNPDRYITYVGWEKRFGYGRTNLGNAVDAIIASKIPPVVDIQSPAWFDVFDPEVASAVDIDGEISYRADLFDSFDYVVEWAPGIEPLETDWTEVASGAGETENILGTIASIPSADLRDIDNPRMPEPDVDAHRYLITVRVRVTLNATGLPRDGTRGEIRKAFHVRHDDDLLPGFPVTLDASAESSAKITDLDGDGAMELVTADSAGTIHVLGADGAPRPGWPVTTDVIPAWHSDAGHRATAAVTSGMFDAEVNQPVLQGPAVGDLDGAGPGGRQVVVATWDGGVFAWDADGAPTAGFPVELDRSFVAETSEDKAVDSGVFSSPVLYDLDGDAAATLEIVVAAMDGHLYAWHHDGSEVAGFPVLLQEGDQIARSIQTPSIGDIDGDGDPEIVVGTNEIYAGSGRLYALHHDGSAVAGWPVSLPTQGVLPVVGTGLPNNTALADFDGDGVLDIAACGIVGVPQLMKGDGTIIAIVQNSPFGAASTSDDDPAFVAIANGSIGDLDRDGHPDIVWGTAGIGFAEAFAGAGRRVDIDHQVSAWSGVTRTYLPGFPQRVDDHQFFMNPSIADLDNDGLPEVISASGGYFVHAFNHLGVEPVGWPKFAGGWIISAPAIGDLDGDGDLEVSVSTREGTLWAWSTTGRSTGRVDWASFHHDDRNTGNVDTPIGFGSRGEDDGGCCGVGGGAGGGVSALLAVLVAIPLRRRRTR